jgi:hypothetical protein
MPGHRAFAPEREGETRRSWRAAVSPVLKPGRADRERSEEGAGPAEDNPGRQTVAQCVHPQGKRGCAGSLVPKWCPLPRTANRHEHPPPLPQVRGHPRPPGGGPPGAVPAVRAGAVTAAPRRRRTRRAHPLHGAMAAHPRGCPPSGRPPLHRLRRKRSARGTRQTAPPSRRAVRPAQPQETLQLVSPAAGTRAEAGFLREPAHTYKQRDPDG